MAQGATPGFDSHGSFQTSGEVIPREDTVYHFLPLLNCFVSQYFITKQNKWKLFYTLLLDRMYDPCVCPFCDGCSGDDIQTVRHIVSLVCPISHKE
jgi:hypothetical protein